VRAQLQQNVSVFWIHAQLPKRSPGMLDEADYLGVIQKYYIAREIEHKILMAIYMPQPKKASKNASSLPSISLDSGVPTDVSMDSAAGADEEDEKELESDTLETWLPGQISEGDFDNNTHAQATANKLLQHAQRKGGSVYLKGRYIGQADDPDNVKKQLAAAVSLAAFEKYYDKLKKASGAAAAPASTATPLPSPPTPASAAPKTTTPLALQATTASPAPTPAVLVPDDTKGEGTGTAITSASHDPFEADDPTSNIPKYKATQSTPSHSIYITRDQAKAAKEWAIAEWTDTFTNNADAIKEATKKDYQDVKALAADLEILYRPRAWTAFPWTSVNGAAPEPIVYDDVHRGYQGRVMYEGWAHKRHQIPGGPNIESALSTLLFPTDASESRAELLKAVGLGDMVCTARADKA
jgi:hypothetical protein